MSKRICSVPGCAKPTRSRGYCNAHYLRLMRGKPLHGEVKIVDPDRGCVVQGCTRPHRAKGYCRFHRERLLKGRPLDAPTLIADTEERFWSRVNKNAPGQCWEWTSTLTVTGSHQYGTFKVDNQRWGAHRYSWTLLRGEIPEGLVIDHKCRNTKCVNPDHLHLVTQAENMQHLAARSDNASGYRGVYWDKDLKKWRARAQLKGRSYYLGIYPTAKQAGAAAAEWRRQNMPNSLLDKEAL